MCIGCVPGWLEHSQVVSNWSDSGRACLHPIRCRAPPMMS